MNRVLVLLADGFEDIEAVTVIDLLRRAKIDVDLVSIKDKIVISGTCIVITADKTSITEAISQLFNNAIVYTQYGSITIGLKTEKIEDTNYAIISIEDTGVGISEEKLNSIFEDFRQGSEGYSRAYEGLGLGLALVKNIIDLHSGEITVESKVNEGSLFKIKLEIKTENLKKIKSDTYYQ